MLSRIISSGVDISLRITGVNNTANIVRAIPATTPNAASVCIALWSLSLSFAPYALDITTPAPAARPLKKPTSMKIIGADEETAARASRPRKFPTIRESAAL